MERPITAVRPDGYLGRICAPHDLTGATAICRCQHDLGAPDNLARRVSVGEQSFKLLAVSGAILARGATPFVGE